MPDMEYDAGTLREGARGDRASADGARATESTLRAGSIAASAFGDVGNAAAFAGQATLTQRERADGAAKAAEHRDDQGVRADSAARQGDGLTGESTAVAQSSVYRSGGYPSAPGAMRPE
jgi:hypothetical protein